MIQISEMKTKYVGETDQLSVTVTGDGSVTVSAVTAQLMQRDGTQDLLSTYSTGTATATGTNQITGPLVGANGATNILPGFWTLYLTITYNGGLKETLYQDYEFKELKGN